MRVIFMGTPDFAVPALHALADAGHAIVAVYTQPPRPAQRGKRLTPSPVHVASDRLGLPVFTPLNFKDEADRDAFAAHRADVAVVAAYGLILPQAILDAQRLGCINIHASLLPRWRGAAPIQRAILAGDDETGVTIMQMERGLDTGPMLLKAATQVDRKTAGELTAELAAMGARLIVQALETTPLPIPQPADGVTYAAKIEKSEALLDFGKSAVEVERAVRAFNPAPSAYALVNGERLRILGADVINASGNPGVVLDSDFTIACGSGAIRPTIVQRAGKQAMTTAEMLRGLVIPPGTRLNA